MSEPFLRIPEPSLPEHNLLRRAGTMPKLTSGLRDRVLWNCHAQIRYGRWADRARVAGSIVAACLLVIFVWNFRWTGHQIAPSTDSPRDTVQHDAPTTNYPYTNPEMISEDDNARAKADPDGRPIPEGGPSIRRETIPEMRELNQMIEKLQSRQNVLCGLLPYL